MLTLTTPLARTVASINAESITVAPGVVTVAYSATDSVGGVSSFTLALTATTRQGIRVTAGLLEVFTENVTGEMAATLSAFAGAAGGVPARLLAVETRHRSQNLLPAGTVA